MIVVRPLFELYPDTPADSFSPSCLKAVRERMVMGGLARKTVNDRINLIRQIFRWGVSNELVEVDTWARLRAVEPLLEGKTKAPDHPDIEPVEPCGNRMRGMELANLAVVTRTSWRRNFLKRRARLMETKLLARLPLQTRRRKRNQIFRGKLML